MTSVPVPFLPLDPGSGMGKTKKSRSRIIFPRAWKQFFGLKVLQFFDAFPDPGWKNLGSGINIPVRNTVNDSSILDAGADGECRHVRAATPPAAATGPVHQAVPLPVPTRGFRYLLVTVLF